jgi:hypothetical protein
METIIVILTLVEIFQYNINYFKFQNTTRIKVAVMFSHSEVLGMIDTTL